MTGVPEPGAALRRLIATGPHTGPFSGIDPVCLDELNPVQIGWRAALYLLACTNTGIDMPRLLAPTMLDLVIAGGFHLTPRIDDDGGERVTIRAVFTATMLPPL